MTPYLLVDHVRVVPESIEKPWCRFRVRLPASEIRLISGAGYPSQLDGSTDARRLGVLLRALRWTQGDDVIDVPLDSRRFVDGFHGVESHPTDAAPVRWTNGNAGLPPDLLPPWEGEARLEISFDRWLGSAHDAPLRGPAAILNEFESLGEDCEFGLAQRHYLVEPPLTLYRWAGAPAVKLIEGLDSDFATIDDPDNMELVWSGEEYYLRTPYLSIHTNCKVQQDDAGLRDILSCGRATLRILRRKLLKDIADAKRIFVFKAIGQKFGDFEMRRLHGALRRIGPASLLCVKEAHPGQPASGSERIQDGLYAARLEKFVIQSGGTYDQWLSICARTLVLHGQS